RDESGRTVKSNRRVGQDSRQTELRERRAKGANKNALGSGAGDNESTDADFFGGQDPQPRGKVHGLRRRRSGVDDRDGTVRAERVRQFRVGVKCLARQGAKEGLQIELLLCGKVEILRDAALLQEEG